MPTRVLVVEDIEDNLVLIKTVLEMADFTVVEARDGREAISQAQAHHPDLILLDMSLPEIDGWSVARTLRRIPHLAPIVIVALTAHAMPGDRQKALDAGCDEVLTKPIDVLTFLPLIHKILKRKHG